MFTNTKPYVEQRCVRGQPTPCALFIHGKMFIHGGRWEWRCVMGMVEMFIHGGNGGVWWVTEDHVIMHKVGGVLSPNLL